MNDIEFVSSDTKEVESSIIAEYELAAKRALADGDPIKLFLKTIASIIVQQKVAINYSAKQNLLAYAAGDYLDHLGILVGVTRIEASSAETTVRFIFSEKLGSAGTIPKGIRVSAGDGVFFETVESTTINRDSTSIDIVCKCTVTGNTGNGYSIGSLNTLVDPLIYVETVSNTSITAGGSDKEDDENFRARIQLAPESFSCAGPSGEYIALAKKASSEVVDVAVISESPGVVTIYPLLKEGKMPNTEVLADVLAICSAEDVRPLTDNVLTAQPEIKEYDIELTYYIDSTDKNLENSIKESVKNAVNGYVNWQKDKLGRDINPSKLAYVIMKAGAERVLIESPNYTKIGKKEVAIAQNVQTIYAGVDTDD